MNWGSASEFFAMGGYGWYVWMSYGICAAVMVGEPLLARRRHRRALEVAAEAGGDRDEA